MSAGHSLKKSTGQGLWLCLPWAGPGIVQMGPEGYKLYCTNLTLMVACLTHLRLSFNFQHGAIDM